MLHRTVDLLMMLARPRPLYFFGVSHRQSASTLARPAW